MSERETALKRILSQLSFMVINAEDRRIVAAEIEALAALPPGDAPQTGADPVPVCQWTRRGVYVVASCRAPRSWTDPENIVGWTHCPYCGKPLALVPAEGDR